MLNISLALAFAIASLFSPGVRLLRVLIDGPLLQSIPAYQGQLLMTLASYWVPAVLIYLVLRLAGAERWLQPNKAIHNLLFCGNGLIILYVTARVFASTVEGGGASFLVISFAPFIIWPALALLAGGLGWLAVRSVQQSKVRPISEASALCRHEWVAIVVALGAPATMAASTLYLIEDAPLRLAREAEILFVEKCRDAGERILSIPRDVDSIYLEPDGGEYFDRIVNGVYAGHGGGILGEPLVNSGMLLFIEKPNDRQGRDGNAAKYRKHALRDWKGEPVEVLASEHGVFQKALIDDSVEKRLGVRGKQVTVKNLKSEQIIASLTYYTSRRHRKICGHQGDGTFGVSEFVRRSLNLTKRFPSVAVSGIGRQEPSENGR